MNQPKLLKWMNKQLWTVREEGPVVKLVLRHVNVAGSTDKIEVWSQIIPNEGDSVTLHEDGMTDLIREIEMAAYDDAEGLAAGAQRYQILSIVKHKPNPHARFAFFMNAENEDVDDTGLSEPATKHGQLSQQMRHNEVILKLAVMTTSQNMSMLQRTVVTLTNQNEDLLKDRRASLELTENLLSQHHERELMTTQAENQEKRYSEMFDKASLLLPAVANRLAGRKLLPENVSPVQDLMKTFAESLSPDQLAKIMISLKPEQRIALIDFMEMTQEQKEQSVKNGTN